jgi:hypothetical protein
MLTRRDLVSEIVAMTKPFGFLILLAMLAACTSVDMGQTSSISAAGRDSPGTSCHGNPWSWCAGYHGSH